MKKMPVGKGRERDKRQTDSITSQLRASKGGQAAATRFTTFVDIYKYMPAGLLTVAVRCGAVQCSALTALTRSRQKSAGPPPP